MESNELKAISLFAGVGGVCKGFINNNVSIVFANDIDKYASLTYNQNFSHKILTEDIHNIDTKDVADADFLLFGFPCQAFSIAGYQKGFSDFRGNLFFEALRFLKDKKPRAFLLENVKNLVSHDNGNTFNVIINSLKDLGYKIRYSVINSCTHGNVPQNRERIYVVGFLDSNHCDKFYFPDTQPLTNKIKDITNPIEKKEEKYYYHNSKYFDMLKDVVTNQDTVYQLRRIYVRENKSNLCPTLTANMGTGGHNVPLVIDDFGIRKLTPRECFSLQGFPLDYILPNIADCHLYKQAGNSVTVSVIDKIAKNMISAMA
jgi:DNA (cytosine-5)-methyltransferase 1